MRDTGPRNITLKDFPSHLNTAARLLTGALTVSGHPIETKWMCHEFLGQTDRQIGRQADRQTKLWLTWLSIIALSTASAQAVLETGARRSRPHIHWMAFSSVSWDRGMHSELYSCTSSAALEKNVPVTTHIWGNGMNAGNSQPWQAALKEAW